MLQIKPILPNNQLVRERAFGLSQSNETATAHENWLAAEAEEFAARASTQLYPLDQELDAAFRVLHRDAHRGTPNWLDFAAHAEHFLAVKGGQPVLMTQYFRNFTLLWSILLDRAQFATADQLWERALDVVSNWESRTGNLVHKGAGLYFWGINQVLAGDLLRGFSLVHEAFKEDQRTYTVSFPDTPAAAFVSLDIEKPDFHPNIARWWAKDLAGWLRQHLVATGSTLTLADFRNKFVVASPDISRVFLFVYAMASMKRLHDHASRYRTNTFVSQLAMTQLFNVAAVTECTIKDKNPTPGLFAEQAMHLSQRMRGAIDRNVVGQINGKFKTRFEDTLAAILDRTFVFPDGTPLLASGIMLSDADARIAVAYGVRNRGGHQTSAPAIMWERFDEIRTHVVGALFLALEHL